VAYSPLQNIECAHDAGEQIIEVMGETAGELSHGLHFLRLS
jgi:hypothetical protein